MNTYSLFLAASLVFISSVGLAKLPPPTSTQVTNSGHTQVAAKDYTDSICQLVIEGNLTTLNERINRGEYGGSHTSIKRMLNKLGVPNGKGCVVNVMKSIFVSMKSKGLDPAVEFHRLQDLSQKTNASEQLQSAYPHLNAQNAQNIVTLLKTLRLVEQSTPTLQEATVAPFSQ